MGKQIVIIGSSGVGKSTALREAFGISKGFGCKSALEQRPRQGYQYMPELTGNVESEIRKELKQFFNNGNITIIDAHPNFINVIEKYLDDVEYIQLVASVEEISRNIDSRRDTKGNSSKDTKIKDSINLQHKLKQKNYKQLSQKEIIDYIQPLIGDNPQLNLF